MQRRAPAQPLWRAAARACAPPPCCRVRACPCQVIDPSDLKELRAAVPAHVLPREYGGEAELVLVQDAVRRHKLPPYPHLPELGSQPCAPPPAELEACDDAAAAISDEPAAKVGAQQPGGSAAVSLQASAQG